jgi:hypothetical protein
MILNINPDNIFVHSKFENDFKSGYDIALIGLEEEHHESLKQYIYNDVKVMSITPFDE